MATNVAFKTISRLCRTLFLMSGGFGVVVFLASFAPAQTSTWTGGAGNWSPCPNQSGTAKWDTCNNATPEFPNSPTANAVIDGGPVTGTGALIQNLSIATGESLILTPGYLEVDGTSIANNGTIQIGIGNGLQIEGTTTVTLSGTGTVSMIDSSASFTGANGSPKLINQQTIQGQGALGKGGLAISNQGTINVTGGELFVQPSAAGMTNSGLVEVQPGSELDLISGPFMNAGGTITALNNSTILLQANISGGTITTAGTGNFTLAPPGAGAGLTGLTNGGSFNVTSGSNLNWQGTINNTGIFNLLGSISTNGTVTLQGGGTVLMNGGTFEGFSANPLINHQLIHGGGTFFDVPLTSDATIQADNASTQLSINGSSTTNTAGRLQASGGGTLVPSTVVNNTGGTIEALAGSTVILTNNNGSVNGGTLTTSGTGTIQSQNGVLDGTVNVPTNAGRLNVHNFDLFFQGTIKNTGTIALTGNSCVIMNKPSTLTGSGRLNMASTTCIFGAGLAFTNDSTIQGAGSIGDSNPMPITNGGTIFANQSSPLAIVPGRVGFHKHWQADGQGREYLEHPRTIQQYFNDWHLDGWDLFVKRWSGAPELDSC